MFGDKHWDQEKYSAFFELNKISEVFGFSLSFLGLDICLFNFPSSGYIKI